MAARWKGQSIPLIPDALDGAVLVVDGLFGAGLNRPLEGAARDVVKALGALPVVAIDVPSGLSGDSGEVLGDTVVRAALTVTFFRRKPGHLLLPGRSLCGEVVVADIGIPPEAARSKLFENTPALWDYPWPKLRATNMPAVIAWWRAVRPTPPGRRGWRRVGRCASAPGW